jgi:hypothetical protein
MEVRVVRVTLPLAVLVILGNVWMAVSYAQGLAAADGQMRLAATVPFAGAGMATVLGGLGPLGFWAFFFGLLGVNNGLVLLAFSRWVGALRREQATQAEIRAAMRWADAPFRWQQQLWLDAPPPAALRRPAHATVGWHLPYLASFMLALLLPAALLSLCFAS